jgi:hypothetical protein
MFRSIKVFKRTKSSGEARLARLDSTASNTALYRTFKISLALKLSNLSI